MIIKNLRRMFSATLSGRYDDMPVAIRHRFAARAAARDVDRADDHRPHIEKLFDPIADHVIVALIPKRAMRCFLLALEDAPAACTTLEECMEAILTNLHEIRGHRQSGDDGTNGKIAAAFVRIAYRSYEAYALLGTHGEDDGKERWDW